MATSRPFRFGVIAPRARSKEEWVTQARRAEQSGYAVLLVPDHLEEQLAPVPAMLAAAEATTTLHVGSYVLDNDFRHPVMLAKEAATLDLLSGGRFELGIGAGWQRSEYEQAGIAYDAGAIRVKRLEETLHIIKGLFAEDPSPFQALTTQSSISTVLRSLFNDHIRLCWWAVRANASYRWQLEKHQL